MKIWMLLVLTVLVGCVTPTKPSEESCISDPGIRPDTALHAAAERGDVKTIKTLLAQGIDVNSLGYLDRAPLQNAAEAGQVQAIKALVKAGAVVNARDNAGQTALHAAVIYRQKRAFKALIQLGADRTIKDQWGFTPEDYYQRESPY